MDAIFFVLRTGCQWHALHATGLCARSAAHRRVHAWVEADVFVALWEQGLVAYDPLPGGAWEWLAMDGAMTTAPLGGEKVGKNPTDRGKIGTKRSVLTDGRGVPLGLAVDGAHRNDGTLTRETIERIAVDRPDATPDAPQGRCLDQGYAENEVRALLDECGFTAHIRARGEEAEALKQEAGFKARRWVVERTHSGMHRFRRILLRWDKQGRNDLGFLHLACAYITYRQSGLLR
jgi:transposase